VHAYFPTLTAVLGAGAGGVLIACLVVVAAARMLPRRPVIYRPVATIRFVDLLPALFAAQLVVFMAQETIEAVAAGSHIPSVVDLLFWGTLGQLPAAAIAAGIIRWLLARLEAAWAVYLHGLVHLVPEPPVPVPACAGRPEPASTLRLVSTFPAAFRKRGPPLCSNT
jgi:hypothetical protein